MKLEFISNTGCFIEHNGSVIGMDIWLTQGPFEGSWFHYPPLRKTKYSIKDCEYIYISHIHPDHFDLNALINADKDATFIVPNYFNNLLEKKINNFGFKNIISMGKNESLKLKDDLKVTLFGQFVNNLYSEANFGNMIDSAILFEWDSLKVLNCNDNYLDKKNAEILKKKYSSFDLALLPHSASGPYPATFSNLSIDEKKQESTRLQKEYINHFYEITKILEPKAVIPMAAEYAIVGKNYYMNPYIGLASAADAVRIVNDDPSLSTITNAFELDCGTILDLDSMTLSGLDVRKKNMDELMCFAKNLKDVPYSYEWETDIPDFKQLNILFNDARRNIWKYQERLNWKKDFNIIFNIDGLYKFGFNFNSIDTFSNDNFDNVAKPFIECKLTLQLFYSILIKKCHWNNAEGGLHIDFFRDPNIYIPEVFVLLSFLHVPNFK